MFRIMAVIVRREMVLAMRRRSEVLTTLFFFVIVVSLFPIGIGPEVNTLKQIGPGVVWVAALLATLLSMNRLFSADLADGTLEQFLLLPQPLSLIVLSKIFAHWLLTGLPLVLLSPVLALQLGLPIELLGILTLSLLIGTPALSMIGAVGAGLTLGLRGGGVLLSLLILPLYIPVLIFGAGAVEYAAADLVQGQGQGLALLGAVTLFCLVFSPLATAMAIRISID